ncbi:high affinity methionine permease [Rhizodiscina lignyota]|uniref:High affinity methionine permease n=1 Tax=Rhizodiscina lignyota TaxID=1504668 RepID=A0A9P4I5J3_9PEZI|nr:high affinity methionine permease [Rhizodiscina lignyota]
MAFLNFISRQADPKVEATESGTPDSLPDQTVLTDGSLQFTGASGENTSKPTYQEASGAPVESKSPLGYSVGWVTVIFLNLSKMVGTGIFSTPSTILAGAGSVGLALFYWVIGFIISLCLLAVYLEFAAHFPSRSGSEVVYLEQAYPRPRYFFPTVFAVQTVILSFSSSNAIVLAQYLYKLGGTTPTAWQQKGVAVAGYTVAFLLVVFNTRWSLRAANVIGFIKLITLIFIGITGLVVLGGHTSVKDPTANFRDAFNGTSDATPYGATNAMVKIIFSYAGYENAFNVVNEVRNPVKTLRWSAPLSLVIVTILYILANIAYFSAATKTEILESKVVAASIFFQNVFGGTAASKGLNFLICVSAFGNLVAVLIGQSRTIRECGRFALTMLMILAPPAGDAFNFVVDLSVYPVNFFNFTLATGLLALRWRRKRVGLPSADFCAWDIAIYFTIIANLYMLIMPWYPPSTGATGGDVSFWYATYVATGVGIIVFCSVYYWVWIGLLPKLGKYKIRQTYEDLGDGAVTHKLVRVRDEDVAQWDDEHDVTGRLVHRHGRELEVEEEPITLKK